MNMNLELQPEPTKPEPNFRLRKAREARGWTQAMLAEKVPAGLSTVRSWEDGRKPSVVYRARVAELFGMSQEELGWESDQLIAGKPIASGTPTDSVILTFPAQNAVESVSEKETEIIWGDRTNERPAVHKNRQRMLQRVYAHWISDMLDHISPLIPLNLCLAPERVASPWRRRTQDLFAFTPQEFSSTSIEQVFERADGELLILGETGTGKTVLLLQLVKALLARCQQDDTLPIPVIFNLPSWAEKKANLGQWLVEQLQITYQVPHLQALEWIQGDHILPLFDGLDEVETSSRAACIDAINIYRQEHGFLHMVVCCRSNDYDVLPNRLVLDHAIVIKNLTFHQIDEYIEQGGEDLAAMQLVLQNEPELHTFLSTPLMLRICAYSARGMSEKDIQALRFSRNVMLTHYIERLLLKEVQYPYTVQDITKFLSWLAWKMEQHNVSEVYIERLQPSWMEDGHLRNRYQHSVVRLVIALQCLVSGGLVAWLKGGLKNGVVGSGNGILGLFGGGSGNTMLGWMAPGLGGGTQGGMSLVIILGIVIWLVTVLVGSPSLPSLTLRAILHGLKHGVWAGLKLGVGIGVLVIPLFAWRGGLNYGITYGLGTGCLLGMLMGLMRGFATGLRHGQSPIQPGAFAERLVNALIWGICGGLSFAAVEEMLRVNQQSTVIYGSVVALFFFAAYGFGGAESLFFALTETAITPIESVTWSWSQMVQNFGSNALKSLLIALVVGVSVSLSIASVASFFFHSLSYGAHYGLVLGTTCGLIVGIAGLLTTLLKSGWTGKMLPEELHTRPNEGVTRSARNALLGACFFAPIGGIASGLACGLGFGAIGQLSTWAVMAMGFAVMLCIVLFVIFFTAHGGIPWVQHHTLRFYLQRSGCIPRRYLRFLSSSSEYSILRRVGGGYMFSHRQILEHFARLHHSQDSHS